jgi:hypothetical protein
VVGVPTKVDRDPVHPAAELAVLGPYSSVTGVAVSEPASVVSSIEKIIAWGA